MIASLQSAAAQIRQAVRVATEGLVGREQLAELIVLAAVAQEHILVIGPPGTAKSAVVRRVAQSMGGAISNTCWAVLPSLRSCLARWT